MYRELTRRKLPRIEVTAGVLQVCSCVTMACYTLSMSVLQNGLLQVNGYSQAQLAELLAADPEKMVLSTWAVVLQLLGGLGIPVFAFLLTEAFRRPDRGQKTLLALAVTALVSEIPYDLAASGTAFDFSRQNMLLSLTVCWIMLYGLRMFAASKGAQGAIVLAAVLWTSLLRGQFGLCLVLLCAVYYLLAGHPKAKWTLSAVIGLMYVTSPLSNFVLSRFNGQGKAPEKEWLLLAAYPIHLLLLGAIAWGCRG